MNNEVPFIVHEGEVARLERVIKRLWIMCIIVFVALVLSNGAWTYYISQWQTVEVSQDADNGVNNFIGADGDIINGKADSEIQSP